MHILSYTCGDSGRGFIKKAGFLDEDVYIYIYRCSVLNHGFKFYALYERWCTTKNVLHFWPKLCQTHGDIDGKCYGGCSRNYLFHTFFLVKHLPTVDMFVEAN